MRHTTRTTMVLGLMSAMTLAAASLANAGNASATLSTNASVAINCTITTSAVDFGPYDPVVDNATADLDGAGSVSIACTKNAAPTIGLGSGAHANGSTRRLANGTVYLTYEFYKDSNRTTVWSDSGLGLLTTLPASSKDPRVFNVYGRIPSAQDVPSGSYSDTVTATVNF
jgi:spore coat protein U-like protein